MTLPGGLTCGQCKYLDECKKSKNVNEKTDYCQWRPNRFELKSKENK